ncbi:hypothetical protein ERO13_A12G018801v2 [Gossypium hirsutum]|uniref:Uncharacterized protein n=3 Tax=Gossypium TaxID=3633 RepID=A0A2P5WAX0_GOSBA|nr:hypothetical protein ES319_A12G018600v1 [Gossypium barbadense]KAG4168374.1 hypothetical protein ERO13_A12G018801v2 [Gossypium hirsutum]PPR88239.1 hypothetical protein GOBAR_AA32448 [Gossypium barbadense]TYG88412.1 hypothetical protein ES288_A12G019100v1 [Gossypium darwinii]TYJ03323.1 hypothetical protein E1A91_A12G019700v1 [Gossypium mustelinum]
MRSKGCKTNKRGKLMKTVRLPIRILCKARDMYIKNMVDCSGRLGYGEGIVCHTPPEAPRLPKSFSVGSSVANNGEEFRQFLRVTAKHGIDGKVEQKMQQKQHSRVNGRTMGTEAIMGRRSYSVGIGKIGRIDEDKPCSFEEDEISAMADLMYPRRRNLIVYL